ncbi:MAG: hypothetical protein CM15mV40_140 [Caudoviricetes sp.]|nr:MAG: hypothetical protein CM15mV40_140 [Caudoviricetes sp.]
MKEKKARVEDALHSRSRCRGRSGPGGGVTLIRAIGAAEKAKGANADQKVGIGLL